ncbi:MAG: GGDEF domain-containing protein [Bryobacterales bacterium]|nr:GGDEF domain-containing protein [Bryobacterales bacterium]
MTTESTEHSASVTELVAWMDLTCSLLDALATHAFRWNQADYESFRQGMMDALQTLKSQPSPSSVLIAAGTLAQRIEHYNRGVQQIVERSAEELRDIIRVLMSSIDAIRAGYDDSASALHHIEEVVGKTQTAEELRVAKVQLTHALGKLTEKTKERKQETADLLNKLQERVLILEHSSTLGSPQRHGETPARQKKSASAPPAVLAEPQLAEAAGGPSAADPPVRQQNGGEPKLDPLTGLLNKEAAEDAILDLPSKPGKFYLAAFYVQRMARLNARYGDKVANELLFLCAQRLVNNLLHPSDQLFRWRGPAFVAVLEREDGVQDVQREVRQRIESRFQCELRGGALLVSIELASTVIPTGKGALPELIEQVESFFTVQSTRG